MSSLSDSVEDILDAIVLAVQESSIEGVKSVVRGDRSRPMPELPSVWVVPQPAQFAQAEYDSETWTMPVTLAALVKGDDPVVAGKLSQRISADARAAALSSQSGMNEADVTDIVSDTFDPTARSSERNRTLFWTEATVRVIFTVTG